MMTIALMFALTATQPELRVIPVDRCEINTVCCDGSPQFTQIVLWRWSHTRKRFTVAQWQMLPYGYAREQRGVIRWRDQDGNIHRVRPVAFIETTGIDTEVADRKLVDTEDRWPYFDACH